MCGANAAELVETGQRFGRDLVKHHLANVLEQSPISLISQ